jgi:hypothetical protein
MVGSWLRAENGWLNGNILFFPLFRCWEIIAEYRVSKFYTAPTAIRSLMKFGTDQTAAFDLSSLKVRSISSLTSPMLRIRDVYPGSDFCPSRIQGQKYSGSVFQPKNLFLSSRKYDLGVSSRIWILIFYLDPGVQKAPNPGSGSATLLLSQGGMGSI